MNKLMTIAKVLHFEDLKQDFPDMLGWSSKGAGEIWNAVPKAHSHYLQRADAVLAALGSEAEAVKIK